MTNCRSFLACLFVLFFLVPLRADNYYGQKIVVPANAASLQTAAQDAAQTLKKMTGRDFAVAQAAASGIRLSLQGSPDAPPDAAKLLAGKSREAFLIRSDEKTLHISAATPSGLSHGLYFYLEQLGVRFLFPNDNWTIIPKREDIQIKIDRVVAPDFRSRDFFGTGGFGPRTPIDPKLEMASRWATWKRRNRFGEEYFLGGHSGEAFNAAHKDILLKNPEYLAKVDGKYVPWSLSAKLNVANADAVKLYVDWSVERFRKARAEDPNYFAVSVDPADSGGHCNSDECRKIGDGSASDMVFYVANETAKAVRKEFPDGWVSLLAYNAHAAVPSLELEPNIYVKVVPYAFQRTGLSAEELIKAWGKKVKRMSVYDYWAITDWAHNQPSFNYLHTPASKLRGWKANNIEGFRGESTFSAGAMGIGWYVASRLMWDTQADEKAIVEEWYDLSFGAAQAPMKRMLERWALGYQMNANQLGMAFIDLGEARTLAANDGAVMARLDDYAKYLHYLRLWLEFQSVTDSPARLAAARNVLAWMWDIYDSTMVQTVRTSQLILVRYAKDPALKAEFDYKKPNAPFWKNVQAPSREKLDALLLEGARVYPVLFQPASYALNSLKPLAAGAQAEEWVGAPARFGTAEFAILRGPGAAPVELLTGADSNTARVTISRIGDEKNATQFDFKANDWAALPIPELPGVYRVRIQPTKTFSYNLRAKPQAHLTALESVEVRAPKAATYFYVAPGQKTVALQTPGLNAKTPITVFDGDNRPVELNAGMLKIIAVPAGQDGKIWTLRGHGGNRNQKVVLLNGPRVYGFSKSGMLVPANPVPLEAPQADMAEVPDAEDGENTALDE